MAERTRALKAACMGSRGTSSPAAGTPSAHRAARILRAIRPKGASARLRRRLASEILGDVRTLDRKSSRDTRSAIFSRSPGVNRVIRDDFTRLGNISLQGRLQTLTVAQAGSCS